MITITKERLLTIKEWRETYGPGSNVVLPAEEAEELARIALASLEAEPVAYIIQDSDARSRGEKGILRYFANISDEDINEYEITVTPLYAAPPETVSVPDAMEMDDDFDSAFEHGKAVGWNACRAAMLQSQGNCIKDGWISCSDRMPEDTKMLLAFSQGEIVAAYWNWVVNPIDYKKYRAFTYLSGNILDDVTHWMPLPEPPL
ncbi:DUF551 domain-containing protein [Escherichia coli]|uniref:DUF551 domain-containing protein n=1 Tax=Escherichia coli TaxID=562 RepID=UPI0019325E48|nr:DUF551 domain-containing protein [Escherichia coli]MBL7601230.1 DUF551 domain-containing protein [Escherichia coli]